MLNDDELYMKQCLELASQAAELGEVPCGAIVVKKSTGKVVGRGFNRRECDKSPLAHAEILAIKQASESLGGWRLVDCTLYCTLEPCPMCAGAIINSRVERIVYGAKDSKSGSCSSVINLFELPYNHKPEIIAGCLEDECSAILTDFFKSLRNKKQR